MPLIKICNALNTANAAEPAEPPIASCSALTRRGHDLISSDWPASNRGSREAFPPLDSPLIGCTNKRGTPQRRRPDSQFFTVPGVYRISVTMSRYFYLFGLFRCANVARSGNTELLSALGLAASAKFLLEQIDQLLEPRAHLMPDAERVDDCQGPLKQSKRLPAIRPPRRGSQPIAFRTHSPPHRTECNFTLCLHNIG